MIPLPSRSVPEGEHRIPGSLGRSPLTARAAVLTVGLAAIFGLPLTPATLGRSAQAVLDPECGDFMSHGGHAHPAGAEGTPGAEPAHDHPGADATEEWQLGPPDLVATMPEPYPLPGGGEERFRNFVLPVEIDGLRYVEGVELRPEGGGAVHHAMLMVDPSSTARRLDARDPGPGYDAMAAGNPHLPPGFFVGWTPGSVPYREPEGFAWPLRPGTDLVLQLHLKPTGTPREATASVGLFFADRAPDRIASIVHLGSQSIDIPPGTRRHMVADTVTLPVEVQALALYPHAHYLAREMRVYALLPAGGRKCLLHLRRWDFDRQRIYRYREPVSLPRRSRVVMEYSYDNSDANPRNPYRPPRRVVYGPRSVDEMADLWVQVAVRDSGSLALLDRAMARSELRRRLAGLDYAIRVYPDSALLLVRKADILLGQGQPGEAGPLYRAAVERRPADVNAMYNLGVALQGAGRPEEAADLYRRVIRLEPAHADAHNNLANLLVARGDTGQALYRYRAALEANPDFAHAHHNLATLLQAKGKRAQAVTHLRGALRAEPGRVESLESLAWLLATAPEDSVRDPAGAVEAAERAVRLTGRRKPRLLGVLAVALASAGEFGRAEEAVEEALAVPGVPAHLAEQLRALRDLFQAKGGDKRR